MKNGYLGYIYHNNKYNLLQIIVQGKIEEYTRLDRNKYTQTLIGTTKTREDFAKIISICTDEYGILRRNFQV